MKTSNSLFLLLLSAMTISALDFKATCTIDRSSVRVMLPYKELTLKIPVGNATNAEVFIDGSPISSRINSVTHTLLFTTAGSFVEARIYGVSAQNQIGTFSKAVLKDDKLWAWSHGFDDNVGYHEYGTEAFNKYGWAGTLFMIGSAIGDDSANWICNAPDIRRLHKLGWAVGNHGWDHHAGESHQTIVDCQNRIRQVLASTDPNYKPAAFASPAFSHDYDQMIPSMRDNEPDIGLMWVEGQGPSPMRLDSGAVEGPWRWVSVLDTNGTVGRTTNIYCYPIACTISWGSGIDRFMDNVDSLIRFADNTHHYWFNTLDHGVDGTQTDTVSSNNNQGIFSFVPWLYTNHGPAGDNTVWVAPSENIYSYTFTRMKARLSVTVVSSTIPSQARYVLQKSAPIHGAGSGKNLHLSSGMIHEGALYDLRGNAIGRIDSKIPRAGLYIIRSR